MNVDKITDLKSLLLIIVATVIIMFMGAAYNLVSCIRMSEKMKLNYTWGPYSGCMVEYEPTKWVPIDQYRVVDTN